MQSCCELANGFPFQLKLVLNDVQDENVNPPTMHRVLRLKHITDQLNELPGWLESSGQPQFRSGQIRRWLFGSRAISFDEMSDLPAGLRQSLTSEFVIWTSKIEQHKKSGDGTEKLLLRLHDGGMIECVLLRDGARRSICVSSQVGCAMGCVFCASGLSGVDRSLTVGEILEQMMHLQRLLPADERLSHIVMMGMGEPLANLDRVLAALEIASNSDGLGISARRITISTVGLPSAIRRMADLNCRYNLAISLHAPNDELRNRLVPVNEKTGVDEILDAADYYFSCTGRKLTIEYVLLADVNDGETHAHQLADLLAGKTALLNVIPYNPVAGLPWRTPGQPAIQRFRKILESAGIVVQIREQKGDEINAACGQLRRSVTGSPAIVPISPAETG